MVTEGRKLPTACDRSGLDWGPTGPGEPRLLPVGALVRPGHDKRAGAVPITRIRYTPAQPAFPRCGGLQLTFYADSAIRIRDITTAFRAPTEPIWGMSVG